jgi:hypothetical protein
MTKLEKVMITLRKCWCCKADETEWQIKIFTQGAIKNRLNPGNICYPPFLKFVFLSKLTTKKLKILKCVERQITFLLEEFNPLKTTHELLYLKNKSVPRSKHFSSYTKHRPLYLNTQSVSRSKHFSSYTKRWPLYLNTQFVPHSKHLSSYTKHRQLCLKTVRTAQ